MNGRPFHEASSASRATLACPFSGSVKFPDRIDRRAQLSLKTWCHAFRTRGRLDRKRCQVEVFRAHLTVAGKGRARPMTASALMLKCSAVVLIVASLFCRDGVDD